MGVTHTPSVLADHDPVSSASPGNSDLFGRWMQGRAADHPDERCHGRRGWWGNLIVGVDDVRMTAAKPAAFAAARSPRAPASCRRSTAAHPTRQLDVLAVFVGARLQQPLRLRRQLRGDTLTPAFAGRRRLSHAVLAVAGCRSRFR